MRTGVCTDFTYAEGKGNTGMGKLTGIEGHEEGKDGVLRQGRGRFQM
jgi:hypothetical protein